MMAIANVGLHEIGVSALSVQNSLAVQIFPCACFRHRMRTSCPMCLHQEQHADVLSHAITWRLCPRVSNPHVCDGGRNSSSHNGFMRIGELWFLTACPPDGGLLVQ